MIYLSNMENFEKKNTDAIADLALENFIEMRDHVADPKFLLKKEIELELEKKFPDDFTSKYSMVTFKRVPYSDAKRKGEIQNQILEELSQSITTVRELDFEKAEDLIKNKLSNH